jgi:E3 ubiquitin-protein ligase RGLG
MSFTVASLIAHPVFCALLAALLLAHILNPAALRRFLASAAGAASAAPAAASSAAIEDSYSSTAALKADLRAAGLESCNLVLAVDHTHSNTFTGRRTFHGQNLHALGAALNLYEQAASMVARTLAEFDEDGLIPAYGFGSVEVKARGLFSYHEAEAPCRGLAGVLARYRELVPHVVLSGGTSFAPAIRRACSITVTDPDHPQFHILLILCDGQVSDECRADTLRAIQDACEYPLSIVCIGVGDGPWGEMEAFDDMTERACAWQQRSSVPGPAPARALPHPPPSLLSPFLATPCTRCQSTTFSLFPLRPPWRARGATRRPRRRAAPPPQRAPRW